MEDDGINVNEEHEVVLNDWLLARPKPRHERMNGRSEKMVGGVKIIKILSSRRIHLHTGFVYF